MGWPSTYEKIRDRRYENGARIPDECQPPLNVGRVVHAADYPEAAESTIIASDGTIFWSPSRLDVQSFRILVHFGTCGSLELRRGTAQWSESDFTELARDDPELSARVTLAYREAAIRLCSRAVALEAARQ
jgi:hypothetical protein